MNIYATAIQIQDACNLGGVARALVEDVLPAVRAELGNDCNTQNVARHPAVVLFAHKLADMAGINTDFESFHVAYQTAKERLQTFAEV